MKAASRSRVAVSGSVPAPPSLVSSVHIFTLSTLSVAHPLYTILAQPDHAPFFSAHQAYGGDIYSLILVFSLALPALICIVLGLLSLASKRLARGIYLLVLFVLILVALMPLAARFQHGTENLALVLLMTSALAATLLYVFTASARSFLTIMSLAVLISPFLFLSSASIRSIISTPPPPGLAASGNARDLPDVVMIVFDELPLLSLLDRDLEIDAQRFPNFHRLAKAANWYKNTTTPNAYTSYAMTSLLVGDEYQKYLEKVHNTQVSPSGPVDRSRIPFSLFSLLERQYQVYAQELVTRLAPEAPADVAYLPPLGQRVPELLVDSLVIYAHVISPVQYRQILPDIEGQWRGFWDQGAEESISPEWPFEDSFKRTSTFKLFIESLKQRNTPSFYFLHTLLPHYPFVYNEHGQIHASKLTFLTMHFREATGRNDWPDEQTANSAQQAHLLQLQFTDLLLGRVLDRLEALGMFEESLIVVTSDHGTSYFWDRDHKPSDQLSEIQASGTAFVPLIIKLPGQTAGQVSSKPTQTIDIVPTIADILGLTTDWDVGGLSALEAMPDDRERFSFLPARFTLDKALQADNPALIRKLELFGEHDSLGIYQFGPHQELLGQPLTNYPSSPLEGGTNLLNPDRYSSIDPGASRVPAYIEGQISGLPGHLAGGEVSLAIAVNGIIRSTCRTTTLQTGKLTAQGRNPDWGQAAEVGGGLEAVNQGKTHFLARLSREAWVKGRNEVTVHVILADGPNISLMDFSGR